MAERDIRLREFCRLRNISLETARRHWAEGRLKLHKLTPGAKTSPWMVTPAAARAYDRWLGRTT